MSLQNYDALRQAIVTWPSLDGEVDVETHAPTIISLAEAAINQDPRIRLRGHLTTAVLPGDATEYALPADCLQVDYVGCDGELFDLVAIDTLGVCEDSFAIDGKVLRFGQTVSNPTLHYYARPPDLKTAGTHWLFELAPDLYLYACLVHVATFSKEAEQEAARYKHLEEECIARLTAADAREQLADSNKPQMRVKK
jgi:hypothetical protein